ncbi:MAG: hypothetical protein U1F43_25025 [Myxococcota bacterium]
MTSARLVPLCLALAAMAGASAAARAEAPEPAGAPDASEAPRSPWFGAFWGIELRGGVASRAADATLRPIPDLGLGLRVATLMSLVDAELGVDTLAMTRRGGPVGTGGARAEHDLRLTSIGLELRLHPMFIRYLEGGTLANVMASIHLALGGALELLSVAGPAQDATQLGFGLRFGLGFEVPLTRPSAAPWSLWLGVSWRMTVAGFSDAPSSLRDMDRQVAWLSLSFKWHDIDFARFPHPPELRDGD